MAPSVGAGNGTGVRVGPDHGHRPVGPIQGRRCGPAPTQGDHVGSGAEAGPSAARPYPGLVIPPDAARPAPIPTCPISLTADRSRRPIGSVLGETLVGTSLVLLGVWLVCLALTTRIVARPRRHGRSGCRRAGDRHPGLGGDARGPGRPRPARHRPAGAHARRGPVRRPPTTAGSPRDAPARRRGDPRRPARRRAGRPDAARRRVRGRGGPRPAGTCRRRPRSSGDDAGDERRPTRATRSRGTPSGSDTGSSQREVDFVVRVYAAI